MTVLSELIPSADALIAMPLPDLAPILLRLARERLQPAGFTPDSVTDTPVSQPMPYPPYKMREIENHLAECWEWLRQAGLIAPSPGINGRNGWMNITTKGAEAATPEGFAQFRAALAFPKELLHPSIADKVWGALMRGDLDEAVFAAFKAVEVAVRTAGGFTPSDLGVKLMRQAFDKDSGPLTDLSQPEGERDALAHLFAGAIGSYKNPHSHRTVNLTDQREAQEQVLLASHLLSIVEARNSMRAARRSP